MAREYRDNAYRIVIMRRNITGIDSMNLGYSDSEMCGRVLAWRSLFASMGYGLPKPVKVFQLLSAASKEPTLHLSSYSVCT